jgi:CRP-like cAMP-binding protein/predicted MFS family arabinose efflux permease
MTTVAAGERRRAALRAPLGIRAFRRLLAAMAVSIAGDWLYNVALLVFVYESTHSAAWVGATTIVRLVPYVLLGSAGGALADRYDRRSVMVASDIVRGLLMLLLAALAWRSGPVLVALFIAFLSTAAGTPYAPAVSATLPAVVPEDDLAAANTLSTTVEHVAIILGPAAGGLLLLIGPPAVAFSLNGVSFLLSALAVSTVRVRSRTPAGTAEPGMLRRIADGMRALRASSVAAALAGCMMVTSCIYGMETVLLVLVSESRLNTGANGIGYLLAAVGLGGVLAAGITPRLAESRHAFIPISAGVFAMGLPLAALAFVTVPAVAFVLMTLQGMGNITLDVVAVTTLQRTLPKHLTAGIFGIIRSLYIGATLLGALVAPPLVAVAGLRAALLVAGVALPCLALLALPALRSVDVTARRRVEELAPALRLLEGLSIFVGVPRPSLELLAGSVEEESVPAGTLVVRQGEPSRDFYIVASGVLDVVSSGEMETPPVVVNTLQPGDYFGEIGLLEEIPRTASVQARSECKLERIDGRVFLDVVNQTPSLSGTLLDGVVGRLARTHPTYQPRRTAEVMG